MDSDKYEIALNQGIGLATAFWVCVMLMFMCCAYEHGKHVGKLEAAVPAESQNRSLENEN